jgi:hypothetical protein
MDLYEKTDIFENVMGIIVILGFIGGIISIFFDEPELAYLFWAAPAGWGAGDVIHIFENKIRNRIRNRKG